MAEKKKSLSKKLTASKSLSSSTSSTFSTASDEDLKVYCQSCVREGAKLPAHGYCTVCKEHLCKTCFNVHKKHKLSRHHTLLDAKRMPISLNQFSASINISQHYDLTQPCTMHSKEKIKYYCHDHKELLCSVCVTLKHPNTVCEVNYIPDISSNIIDSKEYQDMLKAIKTTADECRNKVKDIRGMTGKSNNSLKDVLADIKKYRQEINQILDELEKQAEDIAKLAEQDDEKSLKAVVTSLDDLTKTLETSSDTLKQLNTSKQADKLFLELKLAEKTKKDVEENMLKLTSHDVKYIFNPNKAILTLLKKEKSLGSLTQRYKKSLSKSVLKKSRQASHQSTLCVKTPKDKYECLVSAMIFFTPDCLIISDYLNKALKVVDTSTKSVTDQLQLDGKPWDITKITNTELAVTFSLKQTIQFISISNNKLRKNRTLKVDGVCHGVGCYLGKLVVSFCDPAKVQIIDMNDTVLSTIDGETKFKNPQHILTNSHSIYVSDLELRRVVQLSWQGKMNGSYGVQGNPCGIALSDDGTVFVCDDKRNVIEEISGDCSKGEVLHEDLKSPQAVCWHSETRMLYYSCYCHDECYDNYIHIYKYS
ncbi:E3 ubiquitin-protein ligase TRIM71-like [Ruditapes philippinarum]|uniref:E3 ubiquitin-protein ligase TRIM71-like n=1 Tax=Ruditapes philippinarum TaxID=129788 RepID=UPI00295B9481|nr:E3 ubiquitin-protein ligase TRIM71-like [Ruditapes philippinarum]